jgi:hypothetical protein
MFTILCRDRRTRPRDVQLLVVHTNEGPEKDGSAVSLAKYCQTIQGGYHEIVDNTVWVQTAQDNESTNGAAGVNDWAWHLCLVGYANQTPQQWADQYSRDEGLIGAARLRAAADRFGIPMRRLSVAQVKASRTDRKIKGICAHADVTAAFHQSTHTDPGPNFPWGSFLATTMTQPVEEDMTPDQMELVLHAFFKRLLEEQSEPWITYRKDLRFQVTEALKAAK